MKIYILATILLQLIYVASCDPDFDKPAPGEVVWSLENQRENLVGTQPLIQNGVVYFIQDGYLKAVTLAKGERKWSRQIARQGNGGYSHTILHSNDKLFIDRAFDIQAHLKSDGSIAWQTDITEDGREVSGIGEPIMSQDDTYLYAGRRGYVVKVRKSDGQIAARYPLDRMVPEGVTQGSTKPIISPYGDGILYVPTSYFDHSESTPEEASGGNIFAFDVSTGNIIWERHITVTIPNTYTQESGDSLEISPQFYDIGLTENRIIAIGGSAAISLDRNTGEIQWKTLFIGDRVDGFDVGLVVHEDGIYIASAGWHATKLDLETGNILWRRNIKFSNTSIPTVQNGRLYFNNSGGGGIWILNTEDGSVIYNKNTPNHSKDNFDVYISSLGVGEGYMVNVGSKAVYCLRVP